MKLKRITKPIIIALPAGINANKVMPSVEYKIIRPYHFISSVISSFWIFAFSRVILTG